MEALDEAVGLGSSDLRGSVFDFIELQEELVGVLLIPTDVDHRFRGMPSTDSDPCRPSIPTDADRRFRRMSSTSVRPWRGALGTPACRSRAGGEGCWMT